MGRAVEHWLQTVVDVGLDMVLGSTAPGIAKVKLSLEPVVADFIMQFAHCYFSFTPLLACFIQSANRGFALDRSGERFFATSIRLLSFRTTT